MNSATVEDAPPIESRLSVEALSDVRDLLYEMNYPEDDTLMMKDGMASGLGA